MCFFHASLSLVSGRLRGRFVLIRFPTLRNRNYLHVHVQVLRKILHRGHVNIFYGLTGSRNLFCKGWLGFELKKTKSPPFEHVFDIHPMGLKSQYLSAWSKSAMFLLAFLYDFLPLIVLGLAPMYFVRIYFSKYKRTIITKLYIAFLYCSDRHWTSAIHTYNSKDKFTESGWRKVLHPKQYTRGTPANVAFFMSHFVILWSLNLKVLL